MIEVKLSQKANLKGFTLIEGFPGAGLVGPMAISYIVEKLGMKYIGRIDSDGFPPLVAIHNNKPMAPIRVYMDEKGKFVTVIAEFAIPLDLTYEMSRTLYDFIAASGISKIVSIGGVPIGLHGPQQDGVFAITSTDDLRKDVQKAGLKPIGEGVATGISALLLLNAVTNGLPDVNILVPVDPNILDPKYAETAIINLNKLIKLGVNVNELDKEAKDVENKIRDLLKKNREVQDAHKKAIDAAGPPTYA